MYIIELIGIIIITIFIGLYLYIDYLVKENVKIENKFIKFLMKDLNDYRRK